jgi:hypothetical protein
VVVVVVVVVVVEVVTFVFVGTVFFTLRRFVVPFALVRAVELSAVDMVLRKE